MIDYNDIAKMFEEIEIRLISSLKRNLHRHKTEEAVNDFNWASWQAEKLRNIDNFRKNNAKIVNEYVSVIDDETLQLMQEQFSEGVNNTDEVISDTNLSVQKQRDSPSFFGVNENKMQSLMHDITSIEKHVETAALRTTDDIYRTVVNRVQLEMGTGSMTITQAIDSAAKEFLERGINCIQYSDGRRVNIADYIRMALRTTSTRAMLQGEAKRRFELGYDTVMTSQYSACSETCEPWQGKVYIDDVFTLWDGKTDGVKGISIYSGKEFLLLSTAIHNGLFHPNCRHTLLTYIDGVTLMPEPISADKIRVQRELQAKQRKMENDIRKLKRLSAGTENPDTVKAYRKKLLQAQSELKAFVAQNSNVLKRDYAREKTYGVEKTVDKSSKSDIIKIENVKNMTISSIERPIEMPIEQRHTGKGNPNAVITFGVELNNRQKKLLEQLTEFDSRIFTEKSSVNMADLSALTANTGHEFAMFTKGEERLIIRGNEYKVEIDVEAAKKLSSQGYRWSGHTHPGTDFLCMQPSDGDYAVLDCFKQSNAVIYNSKGNFRTFEKRE